MFLARFGRIFIFESRVVPALKESGVKGNLIHVTPFICKDPLLYKSIEKKPDGTPVIVASGYWTKVYNFKEVILIAREVAETMPDLTLILVSYGPVDEEYRKDVIGLIEGFTVTYRRDLSNLAYLKLLAKASLLLRCNEADSYGLNLAEAMCLGVPSLATNVCARCASAETYALGNVKEASRLAIRLIRSGRLPEDFSACSYGKYLKEYSRGESQFGDLHATKSGGEE